jgi:hypothetical protein
MDLSFIRRRHRDALIASFLIAGLGAWIFSPAWAGQYLAVFGWMTGYLMTTQWLVVSVVAVQRRPGHALAAIFCKLGLLTGLMTYLALSHLSFGAFLAGMNTWFIVVVARAAIPGGLLGRGNQGPGVDSRSRAGL